MDFQHRPGGKAGTFGVASSSSEAIDRRDRLRRLALETFDVNKDPYIVRNYVGQYECKLCLTVHPNEGNYLAHTQGKRHTENLAKRVVLHMHPEFFDHAAAKEARDKAAAMAPMPSGPSTSAGAAALRRVIKIGRPGYRVIRARDPSTGAPCLRFEVVYPEIESGLQPRHRFMAAFEQRVEPPNKELQYLLIAAPPYETIAFAIPSAPIDREPGKFFTHWDEVTKTFTLQLQYKPMSTS